MKNIKKLAAIVILAALTCVLFTGCSSKFHGTWKSVKVQEGDSTYDTKDETYGEYVKTFMEIEIEKGGEGKVTVGEDKYDLEWEADGDEITLKFNKEEETAKLEDDQLVIKEDGFKVWLEKEDD